MEIYSVGSLVVMNIMALLLALVIPSINAAHAHVPAPAPAPASDGVSIDQGIAYLLMVVALLLTYIIH